LTASSANSRGAQALPGRSAASGFSEGSLYWLLGTSVLEKPFGTEKDYLPLLANTGGLVYNPKSSSAYICSTDDTLSWEKLLQWVIFLPLSSG